MTNIIARQKVLELRAKEMSYSQIRQIVKVSKSTLSRWLVNQPLSRERIRELRDKNEGRIEKYRETMQKKRDRRLDMFYKEEKKKLLPLTKKQLSIAGLFLYWGEGNKSLKGQLSLNNTDPDVVKFALYWYRGILKIPVGRIRVYLHLYSDMVISEEIKYWTEELKLPVSNFAKPYIKESKRAEIDQKGFAHGTCGLVVNDIRLKERVIMGIKAVADYYSHKI